MKQSIEEVAKFNPRLAQIPTINPDLSGGLGIQ